MVLAHWRWYRGDGGREEMRMGVVDVNGTITLQGPLPPTQDPSVEIVPGTEQSGGYTSGPSISGDTLMCPPGFPYDYSIHDCHGYAGSAQDVASQNQQASFDVCGSSGGTWNEVLNRCVMPSTGLVSGIPNSALMIAGGILLLALIAGK